MRQYTTPTLTLVVKGQNITDADHVWVTFADKTRSKVLTSDNLEMTLMEDGTQISVELSQEQTSLFTANSKVDIQANWMTGDKRAATNIKTISVTENLLKEILQNE